MRPALVSPATIGWLRAVVKNEAAFAPLSATATATARRRPVACLSCSRSSKPLSSFRTRQFTSSASSYNAVSREEPFKPQPSKADSHTHYTFFPITLPNGPPPAGPFVVDTTTLRREFLQLQARAHPDLHPPEDKNKAQALSARINEAYKTLQNPLLRAQYLLSLRGIDVAEDETAKVEDPELLMEVLDARERIEEAESEDDLVEMKEVNDRRIGESEKVIEDAFRSDDIGMAKEEAVKLRYWVNIKESLDGWEKGKPVVLVH